MMMSKSLRMTSPMCIISTAIAVLALVSVTLGASAQSDIALHTPQKRNLGRMCLMMWIYTDRFCLDYNDYGCYCGLGGSGKPVDAVDACCQEHDRCYDSVVCGWNNIWPKQAVLYSYDCSSGNKCVCTNSPQDSCEYNTCQCDVKFAQCIGRSSYNERYKGYDKSKC